MARAAAVPLVTLLLGCGGHAPLVPGEQDDRFVGLWLIDQPAHALYEATKYRFEADGTLIVEDSCSLGYPEDYVTGHVWNEAGTVECRFGDRWRSDGPETLIITGDCDDGVSRDIVIAISLSMEVDVQTVDGDPRWDHYQFDWRWLECDPPSFCDPYWCD
jgi:hypothetical protein